MPGRELDRDRRAGMVAVDRAAVDAERGQGLGEGIGEITQLGLRQVEPVGQAEARRVEGEGREMRRERLMRRAEQGDGWKSASAGPLPARV
jgi:hypothetical protein